MKTSEKSYFLFFVVMTGIAIFLATIFIFFNPFKVGSVNREGIVLVLQIIACGFGFFTSQYAEGIPKKFFIRLMAITSIFPFPVFIFATQNHAFFAVTASFCITFIVFLNVYIFYRKTKRNVNYASISYSRKGNGIDNYIDMVGEKCKLIAIEKYINSPNYCVYFKSKEGSGNMLVLIDTKSMSESEKQLLKSVEFEFALGNDHVVLKSDEYAKRATKTSVPVQYLDNMRGIIGKRIYEKL